MSVSAVTGVVNIAGLGVVLVLLFRPAGPLGAKLVSWNEQRRDAALLASAWPGLVSEGDRLVSADRPALLVEFLDYECPGCRAQHPRLRSAGMDSLLVIRHFPLPYHPLARAAAKAVICAAAQGRLLRMHNRLLETSQWRADSNWNRERRAAGVADSAAFDNCLSARATDARIARDLAAGQKLGVEGTPTFFVRDRRYAELLSDELLEVLMEDQR